MNNMRGCSVSSWPSGSAGIAATAGGLCQGLSHGMATKRCRRVSSLTKVPLVYTGQSATKLADGNMHVWHVHGPRRPAQHLL